MISMKIFGRFVAALAALLCIATSTAQAQVVISQVYGGGGNSGATYKNDFIEIFNTGSSSVDISGWSVQYASSTGTSWASNPPTVVPASTTLQPGQYFLFKEAAGTGGSVDITGDASGSLALSGTSGKVALVNNSTAISGACPTGAVVDLVGFGTANCPASPVGTLSNTTAAIRKSGGCTNSGVNSADFDVGAPNPRNLAYTPLNICGGGGSSNPSGTGSATPNSVPNDGTTTTTLSVDAVPGSGATTITSVAVDMSPIGGGSSVVLGDSGDHAHFSLAGVTVSTATTAGLKSLTATISDDLSQTGTVNIALTVTQTPVTIMQIQGHGAASPLAGQTVTTSGIVTAKNAQSAPGFFLQDPADFTANPDLTASRGIYVYGSTSASQVAVGDAVTVTGQVQEYSGSTELSSPTINNIASHGNPLPPAYVLDDHPPTSDPTTGPCVGGNSTLGNPPTATEGFQASNFACLDGMLVQMDHAITTSATSGASGADGVHTGSPGGFYAVLWQDAPFETYRPFHAPGALYPGISGHSEIPVWNGEPQVVDIYFSNATGFNAGSDDPGNNDPDNSNPSQTDFVYHAGTEFSVTGVMQGFTFSGESYPIYEIYPTAMTTISRVTAADEVKPVPDPVAGTLTIGTQNLLHFFNNVADGSDDSADFNDTCNGSGASDTCPNSVEYAVRRQKWATQVCHVLKSPVVLDLEEIENLAVARDLVSSIQTECGTPYTAYSIPGNDPGGINIGILVRSDVSVQSVTQMFKGTKSMYTGTLGSYCPALPCELNDRPPVLMRATWNGYPFALLAIYDRSLSGIDDPAKPYVAKKRAEEAAQIAYIAQTLQSGGTLVGAGDAQQDPDGTIHTGAFDIVGDASVPLIIAGDFNAYEFSDGYADVTGMITGEVDTSKVLRWYSPSDRAANIDSGSNLTDTDTPAYVAPSPTLIDSGVRADPLQHYSFSFDGLVQEIDHIVLSRRAWRDFVRIDNAHGNADTAEASGVILDDTTAARSGDHDGQVLTIAIDRIFADGSDPQP
jgi:uncharacterized protein